MTDMPAGGSAPRLASAGPSAPAGGGWCAALSESAGEPTAGTAPVAVAWLLIEQPGPWGRDALRQSGIPAGVAGELAGRAGATGVRVALVRRPGRHPDVPGATRRAFLAYTPPGETWLRRVEFADPAELLAVDIAAAACGTPPAGWTAEPDPLLLVCTNARRDRCCAVAGRPLAAALARRHPGAVWESSHLGGHRFAATAVTLPTGYSYGRLDEAGAEGVLVAARAGLVRLPGLRGRSSWSGPGQVAEIAVREHLGERAADAVRVLPRCLPAPDGAAGPDGVPAPDGAAAVDGAGAREPDTVLVAHRDGRVWAVRLLRTIADTTRPESCGKQPRPVTGHRVVDIRPERIDP